MKLSLFETWPLHTWRWHTVVSLYLFTTLWHCTGPTWSLRDVEALHTAMVLWHFACLWYCDTVQYPVAYMTKPYYILCMHFSHTLPVHDAVALYRASHRSSLCEVVTFSGEYLLDIKVHSETCTLNIQLICTHCLVNCPNENLLLRWSHRVHF